MSFASFNVQCKRITCQSHADVRPVAVGKSTETSSNTSTTSTATTDDVRVGAPSAVTSSTTVVGLAVGLSIAALAILALIAAVAVVFYR